MNKSYQVVNPADFQMVLKDVLSEAVGQSSIVVALSGDLGVGKTTFVQELGKSLGVTEPITSPTFTIMKQYELSDAQFEQLVHIDAYRIESEEEIGPLQLKSILVQPKTIVCIEWPEHIGSVIPSDAITISISIGSNETRQVQVS